MIDSVQPDGDTPYDLRKKGIRKKLSLADPSRLDRLPPNSIEAEQGWLGCAMLNPREVIGAGVEKFKVGPEVFYDLRHQEIAKVMFSKWEKNEPIDLITLQQTLKDRNQLENVGGVVYLSSLPDGVPSAANDGYYADIIMEKYVLRKMITTCTDIVSRAYEHEGEYKAIVDQAEHEILTVTRIETATPQTLKDSCKEAVGQMQAAFESDGTITGLSTGFQDTDQLLNGLNAPDMIIIAARPSLGKTSWCMNIAEHLAVDKGIPVGVFSLEMSQTSVVKRMMFCRAKVDNRAMEKKTATQGDFQKIVRANGEIAKAPLHIDDTAGISITELRAKARRMHSEYGIKLLVVDYLQLLNARNLKPDGRQHEVALISSGIKELLKELKIPGLIISQLNRELTKSQKKNGDCRKPTLSDLRESGALEQDGDIIGMLYRRNMKVITPNVIPVSMVINKHRNGPTGELDFTFFAEYTRFETSTHENFPQSD